MLRLLPALLVLAASAQAQTVTLTYDAVGSGLSPAALVVEDAADVTALGLLTDDGTLVLVANLDRDGDRLAAKTVAPGPADVAVVLIGTERRGATAWAVAADAADGYTKVEWTELAAVDQEGRALPSGAACELGLCVETARAPKGVDTGPTTLSVVAAGGGSDI